MKSIKKIVAASTLVMTLFSFSFNVEPEKAEGLVCLLFGCKKVVVKDPRETDPLYGDPPDYDSIYGKLPGDVEYFNPNSSNPYGWYGNKLENIMGRDIREFIELDKRTNKRPPDAWFADRKTIVRALLILPLGELKKLFLWKVETQHIRLRAILTLGVVLEYQTDKNLEQFLFPLISIPMERKLFMKLSQGLQQLLVGIFNAQLILWQTDMESFFIGHTRESLEVLTTVHLMKDALDSQVFS